MRHLMNCGMLAHVDFEASVAEFSLPRDVYSPTREDMVLPMVRWLLNGGW